MEGFVKKLEWLESVLSLLLVLSTAAVFQTVSCGLLKRKLGQEGMVTPVWGLSAGFTVQIVIANEYKLDGL